MGDLKTCEVCYNTIREREDKTEFHKAFGSTKCFTLALNS